MRTIIRNATLVNEGKSFKGHLVIEDNLIAEVLTEKEEPTLACDKVIDATGLFLIPGVIDDHVHFRDPGLTHKADMESESRAAAAGGVTSYMDMPNTSPQTTIVSSSGPQTTTATSYLCWTNNTYAESNFSWVRVLATCWWTGKMHFKKSFPKQGCLSWPIAKTNTLSNKTPNS